MATTFVLLMVLGGVDVLFINPLLVGDFWMRGWVPLGLSSGSVVVCGVCGVVGTPLDISILVALAIPKLVWAVARKKPLFSRV